MTTFGGYVLKLQIVKQLSEPVKLSVNNTIVLNELIQTWWHSDNEQGNILNEIFPFCKLKIMKLNNRVLVSKFCLFYV